MKLYKSYVFRDKDPAIDELRTLIQRENKGKLTYTELRHIEMSGGPSITCMNNWFFGTTKRPQSATLEAAGRAIGYKRVWVKNNGKAK